MPKSKSIKLSQLDLANRKLLAAAQNAGLSPDEIICNSLKAAYRNLLRSRSGKSQAAACGENYKHDDGLDKPAKKQPAPPSPRTNAGAQRASGARKAQN
jgi:hypothetical protein